MSKPLSEYPPSAAIIMRELLAGQVLCKTMINASEPVYTLEPSGRIVSAFAATMLIDNREVMGSGDGLFGESQTWRVA